jgi:phosphate-selective porin OprO/OprP
LLAISAVCLAVWFHAVAGRGALTDGPPGAATGASAQATSGELDFPAAAAAEAYVDAADEPESAAVVESTPPAEPPEVPPAIAAELARMQDEIDELRAATKAAPKGGREAAAGKTAASKSDDGRPTVRFGGQVQGDQVMFSQDPVSDLTVGDLQNGAQFRRLRIGARGKAWRQLQYSLGVDFALANQPSYLDNYVEFNDLPWVGNVRVGHYFEPFSLERVTQNFNNTFMERSSVDTFAPARNMGVMTFGNAENERATWQIGTFRTNSDNTGNDSFDSGQALTMRGTWLPFWDEASDGRRYLHLGAAYSFRDADRDRVRFRNTPEIRKAQPINSPSANPDTPPFAPIFIDTGFISASNFQLFDPEFALILGPLSLQSEYAFAFVDQVGGPGLFFNSYMAQVSWFLTGEHRPYDREKGIHKRLEVNDEFFRLGGPGGVRRGLGAWELAARYSTINLNDANIQGNELTDFTFGLNWYLNPYTRMKFNYIRAFLEDRRFGPSKTDAFGLRFDYDF